MSNDNKISDEDRELFKKVVGDVSKLPPEKCNTIKKTTKSPIKKIVKKNPFRKVSSDTCDVTYRPSGARVASTDILEFKNTGLQHKTFSRVKAGKFPIEATLDLHGMTYDQALDALNQFLTDAISRDKRFVMIIHGKGLSDPERKAVLKNLTNDLLRQSLHVLAFHSAKPKDGGSGAVYVLLRH